MSGKCMFIHSYVHIERDGMRGIEKNVEVEGVREGKD